ncbi:hypothetical protein BS47DRAFT_630882 [Hydnum rufescens UP504]|uniref:Uncharacterized protein n=1 Tax=Hydnum rufescens UP504 TaxID=1448309 RepID=A0A9P6AGA4_9AGAM|nr:hypothetical protein BS47DRAFT_630882 [Hydnum rufescens UP504]
MAFSPVSPRSLINLSPAIFQNVAGATAPKNAKALMDSSGRRLTSEDICLVEKMLLEGTRSHLDLPEETCAPIENRTLLSNPNYTPLTVVISGQLFAHLDLHSRRKISMTRTISLTRRGLRKMAPSSSSSLLKHPTCHLNCSWQRLSRRCMTLTSQPIAS